MSVKVLTDEYSLVRPLGGRAILGCFCKLCILRDRAFEALQNVYFGFFLRELGEE